MTSNRNWRCIATATNTTAHGPAAHHALTERLVARCKTGFFARLLHHDSD